MGSFLNGKLKGRYEDVGEKVYSSKNEQYTPTLPTPVFTTDGHGRRPNKYRSERSDGVDDRADVGEDTVECAETVDGSAQALLLIPVDER